MKLLRSTHGSKLRRKVKTDDTLAGVIDAYRHWVTSSAKIHGRSTQDITALVDLLNEYKSVAEPEFDKRDNTAQEVLTSSILEEFLELLFCRLEEELGVEVGIRYPEKGFLDLTFHPRDFESLTMHPDYTVRDKDHDFVIGGRARLSILALAKGGGVSETDIVIPAVAIECKRYLERNMLDECAGTAERVKRATPYCLYLVVAEYLKMNDAAPELTEIDEVFILRRQRNSDRLKADFRPNPIASDLVEEIYIAVLRHLKSQWWDADSAVTTGRLFNRPRMRRLLNDGNTEGVESNSKTPAGSS